MPRDLADVAKQPGKCIAIGNLQAFVGINIEDPIAARPFDGVVARRREIIAPAEVMQLNRIPPGDVYRVVVRTSVDEKDLVDVSDKRSKTIFDECSLVADDQRR